MRPGKTLSAPHIMIYFSQKAYSPELSEIDQWQRVLKFKGGFPREGFCWTYKNRNQFKDAVRSHLTSFIVNNFVIESKKVKQRFPAAPQDETTLGRSVPNIQVENAFMGFSGGSRLEEAKSKVTYRVPEVPREERGQGVSELPLQRDLLMAIAKLDESTEIVMRGSDLIIRKMRSTTAQAP